MTVVGKPDEVKAFYERYADEGTKLSLNRITPRPQELDDWYQWSVDNWGTKWDVEADGEIAESDWMHTVYYDTAWGPPLEFYRYMIEKHNVEVDAEFEESGMGFIGYFNNEEGEETWDYYGIFEDHGDRWSEHVPERFHETLEASYESWKEWEEEE